MPGGVSTAAAPLALLFFVLSPRHRATRTRSTGAEGRFRQQHRLERGFCVFFTSIRCSSKQGATITERGGTI